MEAKACQSKEARLEVVNNPNDEIPKILKAWHDRMELGRTCALNHYANGRLNVHLHVRSSAVGQADFCAVFQFDPLAETDWRRLVRLEEVPEKLRDVSDRLGRDPQGSLSFRCGCCDDQQKAMLVGVVELVESAEGIIFRATVGGVVRLQPLNLCLRRRGDALYHSFKSDYLFLAGGLLVEDGPRQVIQPGRLDAPDIGLTNGKLTNKVVENRAELMNRFSANNTDPSQRNSGLLADAQAVGVPWRIGVVLMHNGAFALVPEGFDRFGNVADVLIGPFDLLPDTY